MHAGSPAEQEQVRLYSRAPRVPIDVVAERHQGIHARLEQWGRWNAERYRASSCYSVESRYREQSPRATGGILDLSSLAIERAVLRLPPMQRETVRMFYVVRRTPHAICKAYAIPFKSFASWMHMARAMVLNILRSIGA